MTLASQILQESYLYGDSPFINSSRNQHLKTFLFGYPISHSLAPILHGTIWKGLQVPWTYTLVESLNIQDFDSNIGAEDFIGSAVTMPHKVSMMSKVDEVLEDARIIGAINTILIRYGTSGKRRKIGANTDCTGIFEAFRRTFPDSIQSSRTHPGLVIGGGGACRSAIYSLWKYFHVDKLYIVNRDAGEVEDVISSLKSAGVTATMTHIQTVDQARACEDVLTIIGTIPDFAPKTASEQNVRNILDEFLLRRSGGYLMDMCYFPHPETKMIQSGRDHGWYVITGVEPLIYNAVMQQVLWLEVDIDDLPVEAAAQQVKSVCGIQSLSKEEQDLSH